MSLAIKELKELQLKSELITIELDCLDEEIIGLVSSVNVSITTMHQYAQNGDYEGFAVFETSNIESFYWGNREHKAIASHIDKDKKVITPSLKADSFKEAVLELNENYDSLEIYAKFDGTKFNVGNIIEHDNMWFKLYGYGNRQTLSRQYKLYLWEDLHRVVVNSPYQNQILELHNTGFD